MAELNLRPGQGWLTADIQADDKTPLTLQVEAAAKLALDTTLYGDAWLQPFAQVAGADVGLRRGNVDVFAGGYAGLDGSWGGQAGVKINF